MRESRPVVAPQNRLAHFNAERDAIVAEVERRVIRERLDAAASGEEASLEYVLNEVAFSEIRRYEGATSREGRRKLSRWRDLAHRLGRLSESDKQQELARLVHLYATDVAGNFNPRVYHFAKDVLPPALSMLLKPISSVRDGVRALSEMAEQVRIEGAVDAVRACAERGTLVLAPTHSSNLDSILLGLGLNRSALPPVTYGAGKNLFTNPFLGFFMHNLGAYKVDRRLRFSLYKDVLKEYSTVLLERGYHSLFFPGGTRSRSNQVEPRLKLGLLGTTVKAFENGLRTGAARPLYVVPMTINYRLVLEAETLIDDYLAESGKSRYIIDDDEFSRLGRVVEFVRKILAHEGAVVLRFGQPRDPFGNLVDEAGQSRDARGRAVDPASYLRGSGGAIVADRQRDEVYTRLLGQKLAGDFRRETVLLSTHLLCRVVYDTVARRAGTRDIYRLLRLSPEAVSLPLGEIAAGIDRLREHIAAHPEWGSVDTRLATLSGADVAADALRGLTTYHTRKVLWKAGDNLRIGSMRLLYYYQNRSAHVSAPEGQLP